MAPDVMGSFRLAGRVCVVTGAASGIGRAYAEACAEGGGVVACIDVDEPGASETARELGQTAIAIKANVADEDELEAAFATVDAKLGPADVVFANAGIVGHTGPLQDWTLEEWAEVIGVDLTSVFLTMRAAARRMVPRGYGKIVVTGSTYSIRGDRLFENYGYVAAKGGIEVLVKTAANHLGPQGVRVNAILPGWIRTMIASGHMFSNDPASVKLRNDLEERIPLRRLGEPADLKGLALFLASSASDFCTGASFPVDGGWLAGS